MKTRKDNPAACHSQDTVLKQVHSDELKRMKWENMPCKCGSRNGIAILMWSQYWKIKWDYRKVVRFVARRSSFL